MLPMHSVWPHIQFMLIIGLLAGYPTSLGTLPLSPPSHSSLPSTLPPSDYPASPRIFVHSVIAQNNSIPEYFLKVDAYA